MRIINCLLSGKNPLLYSGSKWITDSALKTSFETSFRLIPDFVSQEEESTLLKEVEPYLKRLIYEKDHWDDAIINFRETERKHWNKKNTQSIQKIHTEAFQSGDVIRPFAHVLDLAPEGYIKPHVDSIKFCGSTIAVLSLLSDCVVRFRLEADPETFVDSLLPSCSLYILKGAARYDFTHEILGPSVSNKNRRRISIVCRNEVL
ncbi:ALKBH7 [Lepeophtheirus salmonis]|uniref:ALKBH7 n=1 Tax=Lepeophtheirus salmonis TaxID=72036 RepID=A0A0K2UQC0_LEPSM|nr:alpha-ketoglutarate-dependent dioxygenase alkB homolog 7, mitochondrial-like [Lepeophtheirus salmonis]CAB4062492.1 ALKBH7 [Lepeophtheirus salmonis]CAF2904155.1 ALKBH7 [Lepeophtheirus salmonis]